MSKRSSHNFPNLRRLGLPAVQLAGLFLLGATTFSAASFDAQKAAISSSVETQTEEAITSLLKAGIAENQPASAVFLANEWLRRNLPKKPTVLFQAGRAAQLSGELKDAVSFYQQALKLADPKSEESDEAIAAVYYLLIHPLDNPGGAYAFGLNEAKSLAVNPRFRQFDRWFLDQAKTRGDRHAVAIRLLATLQAGASPDQIVALYHGDIRWLLESIRGVRYDQLAERFKPEFTADVKALAAAIKFDDEMRLLLDWSVSVKAYNMAKIDGKEAPAPLAEAKSLLDKFPGRAELVQTDWAGGSNGPHYRDDPNKYWTHEAAAKIAPIRAALPKMSPLQQADLLRTWSNSYYARAPQLFTHEEAHAFTLANPDVVNRKTGPTFAFGWGKFSIEQAKQLAPLLALNPSPDASAIRAIAAAGDIKNFDQVAAALLGSEAWRLGPAELNGQLIDRLWQMAGRPGGAAKRDQEIAKSKALAATIPANELDAKAPAAQRTALFNQLWNDYTSAAPRIPSVRVRLPKVLRVTPEVLPQLLGDPRPEAQLLVREVLQSDFLGPNGPLSGDGNVLGLSPDRYDPLIVRKIARHGEDVLKQRMPNSYAPHPVEPMLRKAVADLLKQNKAESWLTLAWINAQLSRNNAESEKLMEELFRSPSFATLSTEARFGARSWFRDKAMTPGQTAQFQAADPKVICKDLLGLSKDSDVAATVAALGKAIDGARKSPVRFEIQGLEQLAAVSDVVFADEKVQALCVEIVDALGSFNQPQNFGDRFTAEVLKQKNPGTLLKASTYLWFHVSVHHKTYPGLLELTGSLLDHQPSAANALALAGLAAIDRHKVGHVWFKRETDVPRLKSIRGKAAMKLGLMVIPVAANHPAYPIYQSQADWMMGNEDSAWNQLDAHWDTFVQKYRELSVPYLMWALQRTIFGRDEARQEALVKSLLAWAGEPATPLTLTEKAKVEIAYGDIAMQRGQLREAHDIYTRTQKNEAYAGLMARHEAALRRVRTERMAKNFDAALQSLADLELERVPEIWTDVRFARAEVHFDMEQFNDSKDDIDSILAREPNHPDARILLGKVQLKRQKLMEATEVELGSVTDQSNLVPGEKLKVTLTDPTLAVSGAGTEIEVVVTANSGDKETFFLRQFGDEKTKFRGEVPTVLGAPAVGDGKLQVIGNDEVFYAYSDNFRKKMNLADAKRGGPITIASDAVLTASARKLLTESEQRSADMQALMDEISIRGKGGHLEGAAKAEMAARALDEDEDADSDRHISQVAKPGNPFHVRVIDPDRSRTAEIDEVTVSVSASSGDSISRVTLRETNTHSGCFEGSVPTAGTQAQAFAQNSEPGRVPNMVISPNKDYPAWRPQMTTGALPEFTVDLNDNVELGALTISAREQGAGLKKFIVQTAMHGNDWTSVATWPATKMLPTYPWKPSVTVVNEEGRNHHYGARSVYELMNLRQHMTTGWLAHQPDMAISRNVLGPSMALPASITSDVQWKRSGSFSNPAVVVRFKAYFHEKESVRRRFALQLGNFTPDPKIGREKNQEQPAEFLIVVNGKVITEQKSKNLQGEIDLKPGIHRIEIWGTGWLSSIGFGRQVRLSANLTSPDVLTDCPDSFFDPASFPPALVDPRNAPAEVMRNADGTEFQVKFAKDSRARFLRLLLVDQEGPIPALNKLALTQPNGTKVLPVPQDFAETYKNNSLEILSGDKISVRYVDDRFVTKAKERQERFLNVSFTDAAVEFADMEPRFSMRHGEDRPYYEKLLRFPHGKPLSLAIHDADMDVSVQPDKVKVTIETTGGKKQLDATETGDSTGIFKLVITPVTGAASGQNPVEIAEGGTITARYLDHENNRPGVPSERVATIRHAAFVTPQIILSHAVVSPLERGESQKLKHGFEVLSRERESESRAITETVQQSWRVQQTMHPSQQAPEGGFQAVIGQRLFAEVLAPHLALGEVSTIDFYAQTDAGRQAAGGEKPGVFDINAPGTVLLSARVGRLIDPWGSTSTLPIYQPAAIPGFGVNPEMDRFYLSLPLITGVLPSHGALTEQERYEKVKQSRTSLQEGGAVEEYVRGLVVRPGERVHFGFRYTDREGKEQWLTASTQVITHPVFDLMTEDYSASMTSAYVGENLYLRVVDLGADVSDAPDKVQVLLQAKSGAKQSIELHESGPHTGIFKTGCQLTYANAATQRETPAENAEAAPEELPGKGLPVVYGDTIAARYTNENGLKTPVRQVTISKGADGTIEPFSKKYDDPQIAMRTQFSLAEAYLEVAKRHRKLGEHEAAALEYESAKQLLSKAMDQFTDPETRAHAEYLLGTLTMEDADATEDAELKETRYRAALSRFINVTGSYSQTLHASKAQYQIATIYERLKEPEIAAQEYVKLAYKYPDSEYLATSMARLGTHFLKKAGEYEQQAKPLLEKAKAEQNNDAQYEGDALMKMAVIEYLKTAQIFRRLQERFPSDSLAGQAGLRAGQSYMRAGKNQEAVDSFQRVIAEQSYDGKTIRAQAMYWAGMCYQLLKQPMAAYSIFKRLTYDFPESEWAAYARGQLSQQGLLDLENKLELERLEAEQQ